MIISALVIAKKLGILFSEMVAVSLINNSFGSENVGIMTELQSILNGFFSYTFGFCLTKSLIIVIYCIVVPIRSISNAVRIALTVLGDLPRTI